jgi:hypothetical protein
MRIDSDAGASSLPTRDRRLGAGARHRKPQTHIDEQPAGSVPGGGYKFGPAPFASDVRRRPSALSKLGQTISPQRLEYGFVLMHESSSQDLL